MTTKARISVGYSPSSQPGGGLFAKYAQTADIRVEPKSGATVFVRIEENGEAGGVAVTLGDEVLTLTWAHGAFTSDLREFTSDAKREFGS